ncbi:MULTISPECIES: nitroreductase family protein [unclassified Clostridium]|jgi:nitroreductase|uniref:nitroreductase family protein n=1 Tax=Clostridia TaxID=186801 RepID=UPI0011059E26|nr:MULTISPECIES: nitroreductase family protein [unclassified Clostridium]
MDRRKLRSAIYRRHSRRAFADKPLSARAEQVLKGEIARINKKSGLHIQYLAQGSRFFNRLAGGYGMFKNVQAVIALVGPPDTPRIAMGYCGEELVLAATVLGVDSCWVGATYHKKDVKDCVKLAPGEALCAVIALGYAGPKRSLTERLMLKFAHRKPKKLPKLFNEVQGTPKSFMRGMEAVGRMPSALNRKAVYFTFERGHVAAALTGGDKSGGLDLGIAMLHFELGAGLAGRWEKQGERYLFYPELNNY